MTKLTKVQYDVLNAIVLKKMATTDAVCRATGLAADAVAGEASTLAGEAFPGGALAVDLGGNYLPTDSAADALAEDAATVYADLRADAAVLSAAEKFEPVNAAFLKAMSAWQLVPVGDGTVANDHTDPDYDGKVIDRIEKLVRRLGPVLAAFAAHDPRFDRYRVRFEEALATVDQGQPDFISSPTVDSVHNVWFEYHEDLLRSLGRARVE